MNDKMSVIVLNLKVGDNHSLKRNSIQRIIHIYFQSFYNESLSLL